MGIGGSWPQGELYNTINDPLEQDQTFRTGTGVGRGRTGKLIKYMTSMSSGQSSCSSSYSSALCPSSSSSSSHSSSSQSSSSSCSSLSVSSSSSSLSISSSSCSSSVSFSSSSSSFSSSSFSMSSSSSSSALNPKYYVGNGGSSAEWNNAAYWANTSGGIGGAGTPTISDNAIFDLNSPDCLLDDNPTIGQLTFDSSYAKMLDINTHSLQIMGDTNLLAPSASVSMIDVGEMIFHGNYYCYSNINVDLTTKFKFLGAVCQVADYVDNLYGNVYFGVTTSVNLQLLTNFNAQETLLIYRGAVITITPGITLTAGVGFVCSGGATAPITLTSSGEWYLDNQPAIVFHVIVDHSNAINNPVDATNGTNTDMGNNTNWLF